MNFVIIEINLKLDFRDFTLGKTFAVEVPYPMFESRLTHTIFVAFLFRCFDNLL